MKFLKNKNLFAVVLAVICFLAILIVLLTNVFEILQLKLADNLYGKGQGPSNEIVIVGIDDPTLGQIGTTSTWSREIYAKALNNLNKYEPSVVIFDVFFRSEKDPEGDQSFITALSNTKNPILYFFKAYDEDSEQTALPNEIFSNIENVTIAPGGANPDTDEVIRRYPYHVIANDNQYDSLAVDAVQKYLDKKIEISNGAEYLINYDLTPNHKGFPFVSFINVHTDSYPAFDPQNFKDKIVIIGAYSETLKDSYFTPVSDDSPMYGVEIHANAIQTLLDGKFLRYETTAEKLIVVMFLCLLSAFVFMFTKIRWSFLYLIAVPACYTLAAPVMFNAGVIVDLIHPYLAIVSTFMAVYIYRYLTEFKEKTAIRVAFSKYVSPEIVDKIAKNPEQLKLGGEERQITVLFTDIVHFTNISEQLSPESLVALLNEYFEVMIQVIKDEGGTLDKLEGDSIMAFFGAPLDLPDMEFKACDAALKMRIKLDELMEKWKTDAPLPGGEKKPLLDFRCGINSGTAIVGNIGALDRFEYTAIGDTVNLASRLEGANKKYGTNMMVSEFTYEKIKDKFVARELDLIRVVGKAKPVRVYELMGGIDEVAEDAKKLVATFNEGISLYQSRKFAEGMEKFDMILKVYPNDNPSKLYRQRCEVLKDFPPPEDWDGVFEMGSK